MDKAIVSFLIRAKQATYAGKARKRLPPESDHMTWYTGKTT